MASPRQQQSRNNRLSICHIVNDDSLHSSQRSLPRPSGSRPPAASSSTALSRSTRGTHSHNSSTSSTITSRRGSYSNEGLWGSFSPSGDADSSVFDGHGARTSSSSSSVTSRPLHLSFHSTSSLEPSSPTWLESAPGSDLERFGHSGMDHALTRGQASVSDGTSQADELKRKLHASRQGARRSQNRAVLSISLAQNRIDSAYKPVSTLSSYNKQQSGRDVKETEVINVSTMTSAAKTRVFQDITSSMAQRCQDALYGLTLLQQRVDPSLQQLVHDIQVKVQSALDCAIDRASARDRVGDVVRSIQPLYEALISDVQERLSSDNRDRGDTAFDVQAYLEDESQIFWEMRTGISRPQGY